MKVRRIDLDDDEMPERVLAELSHDEATLVATILGKYDYAALEALLPGGGALGGSVYDGLSGGLFNRFYDDGVVGAADSIRKRP